ncbi:MAG: hypothetical protein R3A45_11780 [Bdellovibrionota bacterium]
MTTRVKIQSVEMPSALSASIQSHHDAIENAWRNKPLTTFNGPLLHCLGVQKTKSDIIFKTTTVQYKHYFAQCAHHVPLALIPLSVSGLTFFHQNGDFHILVGTRSEQVQTYPGYIETVPSGTLDHGDFFLKVCEELEEEAKIPSQNVIKLDYLGFHQDTIGQIYDICICIEIIPPLELALPASSEYNDLQFLRIEDIMKIFDSQQKIVPTSKVLLKMFMDRND